MVLQPLLVLSPSPPPSNSTMLPLLVRLLVLARADLGAAGWDGSPGTWYEPEL